MGMSAEIFFNRLNELLVNNLPEPTDPALTQRIAALGIEPGTNFSTSAFQPNVGAAIDKAVVAAQQAIREEEAKLGERINGWNLSRDLGRYGTKYLYRAAWTFFGVGGNLIEDAFYPLALTDGQGEPLDSSRRYTLHFNHNELPPVNAFWSLTMYDPESYLVPNEIDRYALGDRSGLTHDADGSLTLYIQSEKPDPSNETNWLPAPNEGRFKLALRLYSPKPEVTQGVWQPPPIKLAPG